MDYKAILLEDLDRGFSKSDLEKLIGLPQNNLSGMLNGNREFSKKSKLKIEKWMASEKPNPLDVSFEAKEKPIKPEVIGERKLFIPKNQPVLDKFGNILVSEKKIKKEPSNLDKIREQFPIIPRLEGESYIDYQLRKIELSEAKNKVVK